MLHYTFKLTFIALNLELIFIIDKLCKAIKKFTILRKLKKHVSPIMVVYDCSLYEH